MKKISKLKKVALMDPAVFENTLDQISDKGRAILKSIEDYKFSIDQTLRVVKNDQALTNIISQKKKNLEHAAQDLYTIVFEIENVDITEAYNEQEEATNPVQPDESQPAREEKDVKEDSKNEEPKKEEPKEDKKQDDEKETDKDNKEENK